jgi:hypothetical protein
MWNSPGQPVTQSEIRDEHLRVLRRAVDNFEDGFNLREVYAALDFLQARCLRPGGFTMFRAALLRNDLPLIIRALETIRKHLGA